MERNQHTANIPPPRHNQNVFITGIENFLERHYGWIGQY